MKIDSESEAPQVGGGRGPETVLAVERLAVDLGGRTRQDGLIEEVSFEVCRGRTLALIGESGCGKTMTALAILGLLPKSVSVSGGAIWFQGTDLLQIGPSEIRRLRGGQIGAIFQDPMSSLNPTMAVGDQIAEVRQIHLNESARAARRAAADLLAKVEIPNAARRLEAYPHELSGGMQQRVMIAMAIACEPALLLADEPTTALDVTIQADILDLLRGLRDMLAMGILLVTHDLGVVADFSDNVAVMYAGHVIERASTQAFFRHQEHPYSAALLSAMPQMGAARKLLAAIPGRVPVAGEFPSGCRFQARCPHVVPAECERPVQLEEVDVGHFTSCTRVIERSLTLGGARSPVGSGDDSVQGSEPAQKAAPEPALAVEGLTKSFVARRSIFGRTRERLVAVDGVDLTLSRGQTLGIVGESGSGKSTLARLVARLIEPDRGTVAIGGRMVDSSRQHLKWLRSHVQVVFQDPYSSLDPTKTVGHAVREPLVVHRRGTKAEQEARVEVILDRAGLHRSLTGRYPDELSGGQRQRVAIARALALEPSLLIADEPTSALDVSTRSEIANLLLALQAGTGLSIVLVSHDFSTIGHLSHSIAVMYLGRIVEEGPADIITSAPAHPYTKALISAVPVPDPMLQRTRKRIALREQLRNSALLPSGCRFRTRCPQAMARCEQVDPALVTVGPGHRAACLLFTE